MGGTDFMQISIEEEALIKIFKFLNFYKSTAIGIVLLLNEDEKGPQRMIEFLKKSNPVDLTEPVVLREAIRIIKK